MTELLVGTKKGLFVLDGAHESGFDVTARAFAGEPVEYAMRDERTGRLFAAVNSPIYGPKIWYSDDPGGEWTQASGVALPEGQDAALVRIWVLVAGEEDGLLYAGGDPGVLFESRDGGKSWELNARPVGGAHARFLAARRRRSVPALDRPLAGGSQPTADRRLGRRGVADR